MSCAAAATGDSLTSMRGTRRGTLGCMTVTCQWSHTHRANSGLTWQLSTGSGIGRPCQPGTLAAVTAGALSQPSPVSVRTGGVLEHPADSWAWARHGLAVPVSMGWQQGFNGEWVCEVWQSAYGHVARKRTWLLYVGQPPEQLLWGRKSGTKQVGQPSVAQRAAGALPGVTRKEAIGTPSAFRDALIALARNSR